MAAVFRIKFLRLVAGLARLTHEDGRAEELALDALVVALERRPGVLEHQRGARPCMSRSMTAGSVLSPRISRWLAPRADGGVVVAINNRDDTARVVYLDVDGAVEADRDMAASVHGLAVDPQGRAVISGSFNGRGEHPEVHRPGVPISRRFHDPAPRETDDGG